MRLSTHLLLSAASLFVAAGAAAESPLADDEMLKPLTSAYMRAVKPGAQAELHRELFVTALRRVQRNYAREVDLSVLMAEALKVIEGVEPQAAGDPADVFKVSLNAALALLDPYTRYLDPQAQDSFRSIVTGSFSGLGLRVEMIEGLVRVVAAMPDSPAERAGLQQGDVIVRVDDQSVLGMTLTDAISRMRGEAGTRTTLTIRRTGRGEMSVPLVRAAIRTEALRWSMEGDVLVLRLSSFTASVASALEKALAEATSAHAPRAVILDMRGNSGGLLPQAVRTADAFLSKGEIVSIRGRTIGTQRSWQADSFEHLAGVPMVVLIDGQSASAAELVAAALQDNGRAVVMGQRSFGKGSVQTVVPFGSKQGALRLTIALYHAPSGRAVQRTGVAPDIELVTAGPNVARGGARREADRMHALPGSDEPLPPKARVEQARCAPLMKQADPALACALAYLQAGEIDTFIAALEPADAEQTDR